MHRLQGFDGLDVHIHLPLVIASAAGIDVAVADGWLEGRRLPQFQGIGWLDIIMAIAKDGWFSWRMEPVAIDQWMALSGDYLDVLDAGCAQTAGDELGRQDDILFVFE